MFKFAKLRRVLWPVKISVPSDTGSGEVTEHTVKVLYELLTRSDVQRVQEQPEIGQDVLQAKIQGWEGIADEGGETLEYSPEALRALLDVPYIERAFSAGLLQASNGAPAKN